MPATKIVDEQEVIRWFEEGRTYEWMTEQYRTKYNLVMTPSAWSNFRHRRGLARRIIRDDDLIPWAVKEEHRYLHAVMMLRLEARVRAGLAVPAVHAARHRNFMARLAEGNLVVDYDPDSAEGFRLVPREDGDADVIRRPRADLIGRRAAD
jgi:hypothetical protein